MSNSQQKIQSFLATSNFVDYQVGEGKGKLFLDAGIRAVIRDQNTAHAAGYLYKHADLLAVSGVVEINIELPEAKIEKENNKSAPYKSIKNKYIIFGLSIGVPVGAIFQGVLNSIWRVFL